MLNTVFPALCDEEDEDGPYNDRPDDKVPPLTEPRKGP